MKRYIKLINLKRMCVKHPIIPHKFCEVDKFLIESSDNDDNFQHKYMDNKNDVNDKADVTSIALLVIELEAFIKIKKRL